MDPREVPAEDHGPHSTDSSAPPPGRRLSMEEDILYQRVMTNPRPQPPPYRPDSLPPPNPEHDTPVTKDRKHAVKGEDSRASTTAEGGGEENLPQYTSSIKLEGVFSMKHEIENATKRAEDRQWRPVYVSLTGTALNIHQTKKSWSWGKSRESGPSIDPDKPPWIKKSKLEKSYSLLYADAGIAADYKKRRYVIRLRAETDQFLLCCIELSTFVKWLQGLFSAIEIAAPIDDRDFPRDMSIPRIQRIRWFRGESPTPITLDLSELNIPNPDSSQNQRRPSTSSAVSLSTGVEDETQPEATFSPYQHPPPRIDPRHRLSTSSYPNLAIDPSSGKWFPEHNWSGAHDMLYAKLCYSNLLFRSPRKSNYIISQGKQWYVEWGTGRMVRVQPPTYGEIHDHFGAWQTVHTENRMI